jgi:hypothetical protein
MPIDLACPNCGRMYKIADQHAGRKFACKQCGQPVQVPGGAAAAPAAAAPAEPPPAVPPRTPMNRPAAAGVVPMAPPSPEAPAPGMPYGAQPDERTGPRKPNIVFLVGALAMFLGFFLPWISINLHVVTLNIGGYELPGKFNSFVDLGVQEQERIADPDNPKQMADLKQARDLRSRGMFLYSIYLIPLLTLGVAIDEFLAMRKGRNWWWARAIAAASPIIAFITVWIAFADLAETADPSTSSDASASDIFKFLGAGVYISFLGFVLASAGIFTSPKPKPIRTMLAPRPRMGPRPMAPRPATPAAGGGAGGPGVAQRPKLPGGVKLPAPRR